MINSDKGGGEVSTVLRKNGTTMKTGACHFEPAKPSRPIIHKNVKSSCQPDLKGHTAVISTNSLLG